MTANQLRYAELRESRRHSVASEAIEARKAGASEASAVASQAAAGAQYASVAEQAKHNRVMEDIGWQQYYSLSELQSAQASATTTDASTRVKGQQATQEHYERQDAISGARAVVDTVYGGVDTIRKVFSPFKVGGK